MMQHDKRLPVKYLTEKEKSYKVLESISIESKDHVVINVQT